MAVVNGSYKEREKKAEEVCYSNIQHVKKTRIPKSSEKVRILKGGKGEP